MRNSVLFLTYGVFFIEMKKINTIVDIYQHISSGKCKYAFTGFLRLREIRENLEKTFYSGKTWKTQGKIWVLPDLRENSVKKFF